MTYIGTWQIDDALTFYANTTRIDTGAATDADSVPTYRVYEDETGTPILTGSMALLDSANTAGFYSEQITLSAANGFEVGKCYSIYIAATVNSVAGAAHRTFQVELLPLTPTTAGRTLDVSAGGEAGVDWGNVGSPTTANDLSGTNIKTNQVVASVTGAVGSVGAGGIAAASFAAGAIDASAIAANAIGASELNSDVITDIWQGTAITEAYAADGAAATPAQLLYMIWALLAEKSISTTTVTVKKLDGSTQAMTFTLDDATTPTSITRAS